MAVELGAEPYSEAGLAVRKPEFIYHNTPDAVRRAKGQFLDFIFDNPGGALPDGFDQPVYQILIGLQPQSTSGLDLEDNYSRLVRGLEVDGDLVLEPHGEAYFPVLTRQSIDRIAEMRRRKIDAQVSAWERELIFRFRE